MASRNIMSCTTKEREQVNKDRQHCYPNKEITSLTSLKFSLALRTYSLVSKRHPPQRFTLASIPYLNREVQPAKRYRFYPY